LNLAARRELIRDILRREAIASQDELVRALERRGAHATQATVSRDLRALAVIRAAGREGTRYRLPEEHGGSAPASGSEGERRMQRAFRDSVTGLLAPREMLLLKTPTGFANSVAISIDQSNEPDVLATLAGDDTIVVFFASAAAKRRCAARWGAWLA
jgi:transcriptional regulator of arginine metabolism